MSAEKNDIEVRNDKNLQSEYEKHYHDYLERFGVVSRVRDKPDEKKVSPFPSSFVTPEEIINPEVEVSVAPDHIEDPLEEDFFYDPEVHKTIDDDEDDEDEVPLSQSAAVIDEEEDFYYNPEDHKEVVDPVEEEHVEAPVVAEPAVQREILREVLVVDREQARDLGYSADRYMGEPSSNTGQTSSVPPASQPFQPSIPRPSQSAPSKGHSDDELEQARRSYASQTEKSDEVVISPRTEEKSNGFFGSLFGRKRTDAPTISAASSSLHRSDDNVDDRVGFINTGDDSTPIQLKTQENYDPREERRRLLHVTEQRGVDPAVWLEDTMLEALKLDASDLHIIVEGDTRNLRARIRVDGQMRDFDYVTGVPAAVIMGRLKAKTKLSSAGSFAPEETIYELNLDGEPRKARAVLFRVEDGGEALVMRLPLTGSLRTLDELDFADYNLELVRDLLAMPYKLIMIAGPMGSGKGSPAWERILTPNGWTTYGEVSVGDFVIGSDGQSTEVTGVFPRGNLPVYKVQFNDGSSVTVDGDHLWSVKSAVTGEVQVIATSDLSLEDFSGDDFTIPVVEPVIFATEFDREFDFTDSVDYSTVEMESVAVSGSVDVHAIAFDSHDFNINEKALFLPVSERLELLQGFMDTDGFVDSDGVTRFVSAHKERADAVAFLTRSLGGVVTVGFEENLSYTLVVNLPSRFVPFSSPEKVELWVPSVVTRSVASVELMGSDEVICIQVASEDSLYVADDFIVTHNTTTAHGALIHVADPTRTVWSIEDPVERRIPNLVQLEIDEDNGAGFDILLGKLLRADYNTLFLGEIRDTATAGAAVRQAKAGRQVMSTIHADDNIKSMMRLIELAGDSPMSVLSAVGGVISQRLVRRLNPAWDGSDPATKYKGRIPIHEIMFVTDEIVEVMMNDQPLSVIKEAVSQAPGSTFAQDAHRLIGLGVTDKEEIVKVIGEFEKK